MKNDVTLILEGTYPYVAGGVSTWVHQILTSYPDRQFALMHIGPHPEAYAKPLYQIPPNVTEIGEVFCRGNELPAKRVPRRGSSRVLQAIRRIHTDDVVDDALIADLSAGDLSVDELLHGGAAFELLRKHVYERISPDAPFMDFFWHFRAMHVPLLRLLAAPCPPASVYHAVSTGYAGLMGAVASYRTGRPLVVTEHGLYAREREMELSRASWIKVLPLRRIWSHYFRMLSRIAYHQATQLITLSEANRKKQLADGADAAKIVVVPNGVGARAPETEPAAPRAERLQVGFVGRVVPIKDVVTLVRAVALAREQVELDVRIIGPEDEDPGYARRCRSLVHALGLDETVRFLGPQPVAQIYPTLDVVLLTSLSEGQPLVMLEAYSAAVPVIATDVGACRELIEGCDDSDRGLGPSGIVTRVANPPSTATALCTMARDRELRAAMGRAAFARVSARYQLQHVVARYDALYTSMAT